MARIDLNTIYQAFLKSQVDAGLFRSITAAAEHAIHEQMVTQEKLRVSSVRAAIAKGEADIEARRTIPYSSNLMADISQKGKQAALSGSPIKNEVKP